MSSNYQGSILVVDDNEMIRDPLTLLLEMQGHTIMEASNGIEALEMARRHDYDLILLDIMMPEMDGYEVLSHLKADIDLRHIPVVVLSAVDAMESVVRCIKLGAEDYLFKPFDKVLLKARVNASLQKKVWRDQEKAYLRQIEVEREKSDNLLLNILPEPISERLKKGEEIIADYFEDATVLFADIVGFTEMASDLSAKEVVGMLNELFSAFDQLAERYELEKIKTIGDAYMAVSGLPTPRFDHAAAVAEMALAMQLELARFNENGRLPQLLDMRIGVSSGPVMAGVIGKKKFAYDLWGDTVNMASRMESHGMKNHIQVSETTYRQLQDKFELTSRGEIEIKGKGKMLVYILQGKKQA